MSGGGGSEGKVHNLILIPIFVLGLVLAHESGVMEGVNEHKRSLLKDLRHVEDELRLGLGDDRIGALRLREYLHNETKETINYKRI